MKRKPTGSGKSRKLVKVEGYSHDEMFTLPAAFTVHPKPHLRGDSGDFLLPKPLAMTREMAHDALDVIGGVRVYPESPERIAFQIRTTGKVGRTRGAQCRRMYSHVSLDAGDVAAVIAELQRLLPAIVK